MDYATPDGRNVYMGTGEVWFNRLDSSGNPTGYRHLGNVTKGDITPTPTTQELQSSMSAARETYAQALTALKMDVALTLSEFTHENVALALLGDASTYTQSSATKTGATLGAAKLGMALDTGFQKITVTGVKSGATTYAEGTDYTVDSDSGLITILATGTIAADSALTWDGSVPAIASTQIQGLSTGLITGAMRFRSAEFAVGPRLLVDVWRMSIAPSAALSLLADAFGEIALTGSVLPDSTKAVGQRYCRVINL